ncbi:hypothetical protein HGRIS_014890 [Hohenbuehelia grisea]|uniref:F-box domain-containing protein n=1 Tax=Hohenbuehelia grisea TaxID=104357 RepID=A0ABR3JS31_9AGAR
MSSNQKNLIHTDTIIWSNDTAYDAQILSHAACSIHTPTPGEHLEASAATAVIDDDLRKLDDEIVSVQSYLDQVQAWRRETQRARTCFHSVSAPIRRLPDDVLREIFQWCCSLKSRQTMRLKESPWTLSMVCRRWRFLAVSLPTLWTSISISTQRGRRPLHLAAILRTYLERSGVAPLDITHHCPVDSDIFSTLFAQIHRWRNIDLLLTAKRWAILDSFHGHLPVLRSIFIRYLGMMRDNQVMHAFSSAPRLTTVVLDTDTPSLVRLPGQIESLNIVCPIYQAYQTLQWSQSLSKLELCIEPEDVPAQLASGSPLLSLPRLVSLRVEADDRIPDFLHLPTLEDLRIRSISGLNNLGPQCRSLILISDCPLLSLKLDQVKISEDDLTQILASTPRLRTLNISWAGLLLSTFRTLTYRSGTSQCLVPHLEEISIHDRAADKNRRHVLDFVESRVVKSPGILDAEWPPIASLKTVKITIYVPGLSDVDIKERVKRMKEEYNFSVEFL